MRVDTVTSGGFAFGDPEPLPVRGHIQASNSRDYDITPDGRQLLVVVPSDPAELSLETPGINIVFNWFEELKALVPVP